MSERNAPKQGRRVPEGLPSAEMLAAYDDIMPGSAERMVAMFEREQAHRHQWEQRALKVHQVSTILGQLLGFFVAVACCLNSSGVSLP